MNQLEIILKAKDEATATMNAVKAQSESLAKATESLGSEMGKTAASAAAFGGALTAAAGVAGGVALAIKGLVTTFADAGSALNDLSNQTGINVVSLQKLQYTAKLAGVDTGSLTTALVQMEKAASKSPEKFAQLGISLTQVRSSKPEELMSLINDGLRGVGDESDRTRIAMELFGRGGSQMLKMLTDDFEATTSAAEGTGLMTEEMTKRADALGDSFTKISDAVEKVGINLGAAFASPAMIAALEKTASLIGLVASNADKLYSVIKALSNTVAPGLLQAAEGAGTLAMKWDERQFMAGKAGPKFAKPFWETNFGPIASSGSSGEFEDIFKPSSPLERARAVEAQKKEQERAALKALKADIDAAAHSWKLYGDAAEAATKLDMMIEKAMANGPLATQAGNLADAQLYLATRNAQLGGPTGGTALPGIATSIDPGGWYNHISKADEAQRLARESAQRWALALQGVALMAGAIGGKIGDVASVARNIAESFKSGDKFGAIAGGIGQIGGLIGGSAGSGIQGGAGGAMVGQAISSALKMSGPWGAIIGGAAGLIGGLFGASSKQKAELADAKKQLEGLSDAAKRFGIDLTSAFNSKSIKDVQSAIGNVTKAVEDQKKRLEGLSTAAGGFNAFAKGGGITDQASSDRASLYAGAIFAGMVKDTGDVVGALTAIRPALDEMAKKAEEMGLSLGTGVSNLIGMNHVLEGNEGLAQQMSGLNQMMKGLGDAGLMTKGLFQAFGADTAAVFNKLIEGGATGTQALTLMQPTLQQLYEGQKRHGWAIDAATQKLLDEAKAQGVVGDEFMSTDKQMVDLLKILIVAVGGTLPDAYKRAGDAAEEYGRRATASLPSPGSIRYNDGTTAQPDGMAFGGIVAPRAWAMPRAARGIVVPNRPGLGTAVVMGEAASAEVAAPVNALFGSLGDMMAAKVSAAVGGNRGGMVHTVINLDGKPFLEVISNALTSGGPAAQGFRDALAGAGR